MHLSRRIELELAEADPVTFTLSDDLGRQVSIPGGEVTRLQAIIRGFRADAAPDGLDVLAFDVAEGRPGFRVEARPIPTGRAVELPYPTVVQLSLALDGYYASHVTTGGQA